ncbi:hypothetical protein RI129_005888 [Pyrocoelia pectoralis]|uniref:Allantoate amidinohydrolase n=1 Tax=Pyrocoelia pectoralis TaxID=417401 RepID=A0AAN7ZMV3_9COLE
MRYENENLHDKKLIMCNESKIIFATDDWFASAENLLKQDEPIFKPNIFTDFGKWMDGWETRRKRIPGHDWCIIKLGLPGVIHGLHVDTAFFTGNYVPRFSLQAANLQKEPSMPLRSSDMMGKAATSEMFESVKEFNSEKWSVILPMTELRPGYDETRHNFFPINSEQVWTHVRLNIYPDGGIARLRIYGKVRCKINTNEIIDLVSIRNGGICKGYSNAHYGHPRNIIRPDPAINMGDGWETARRLDRPPILDADEFGILRVPGNEWAVFKLSCIGCISHLEVDTAHFKGNFPDSIRIEGVLIRSDITWNKDNINKINWETILAPVKLSADCLHQYGKEIKSKGPFSHVKITIAPDGGISRVRIYGKIHIA